MSRPRRHEAICAETITTLNDALCDFYSRSCGAGTPAASAACPPHEAGEGACEDTKEECVDLAKGSGCQVTGLLNNEHDNDSISSNRHRAVERDSFKAIVWHILAIAEPSNL